MFNSTIKTCVRPIGLHPDKNLLDNDFSRNYFIFFVVLSFSMILGTFSSHAQSSIPLETSVQANFGIDADVHSGLLSFDTNDLIATGIDDWIEGANGLGVIDITNEAVIAELESGANISRQFRMSMPINTLVNGDFWLDAVFLRDQNTAGGNMDLTVFGGGADKNFDNPLSWTIKEGDVPQKNDIIDVYAHIRREADLDNLWAFAAASTRSPNGNNYIDFEYFRLPVELDTVNEKLETAGLDCGHTAYDLDASDGTVLIDGDIIISTNYTNGGAVADIRLYAWIDSNDIDGLDGDAASLSNNDFIAYNELDGRRFNFGDSEGGYEFYNCDNDSNIPYGYARISLRDDVSDDPIFAQNNTSASVAAPSWGTIDPGGSVTYHYVAPTFAEFALNATILGLDASQSSEICQAPLGSVIVKTRSSTSFTSELKDMAGPFALGNIPEYTVTINNPDVLSCSVTETVLTATALPSGSYTYEWFKDGQPFDDASPGDESLTITEPGSYAVNATFSGGCIAESESVNILQNIIEPIVSATGGVMDCYVGQVQLSGTISSTNPEAELSFEWIGPNDYLNSTELNPTVMVVGTYTLTVADNKNGCTSYDTAEVEGDFDEIAPEITCPEKVDVHCIDDVPVPDINLVTASDNSGIAPIIIYVGDESDGLTCPEVITRTYRATDACGNTSDCVQLIIVHDTIAPELENPPADASYECGLVPPPEVLSWTDNCDGSGIVQATETSDGQSCPETITRTWTYTDSCNNTTSVSQTITINDTIDPELMAPEDASYQCIEDVPEATDLDWTDNCDGAGTVPPYETFVGDTCQTITRTWTYTDSCGNTATAEQVITVFDDIPPKITPPDDYTVQCLEDVLVCDPNDAIADDNCGEVTITCSQGELVGGPCGGTVTNTYTATDACGNTETATQIVTIHDTIPPAIAAPNDITVECLEDIEECDPEKAVAIDNCGYVMITCTQGPLIGGPCGGTITNTFTATDSCGNTATDIQIITIYDTIPPQIEAPDDLTVECYEDLGECNPYDAIVSDNCSDVTVTCEQSSLTGNSCYGTITYTYTATDVCGNYAYDTQTITIEDTTPPELTIPEDYTVECYEDVMECDSSYATATDECSEVMITCVQSELIGGPCGGFITNTFTATDACGNETTATQTITVYDTIPPVIAAPSDITIECLEDLEVCNPDKAIALDNCSSEVTITCTQSELLEGPCGGTIINTFTATDFCGNTATATQIITIHDTEAPVLTPPGPITYQCLEDVPMAAMINWFDNCDGSGTVEGSDVSDGLTCPETITRTWSYTDYCDNTTTVEQIITIHDTEAPILIAPEDASYQCLDDVPPAGILEWNDNCDGYGEVQGHDLSNGLTCPETITRTWSYTDSCLNTTSVEQIITIYDTEHPVMIPPGTETYECPEYVPSIGMLEWTDNCDGFGEVQGTETSDGQTCPETITRTWSYTDNCNNTTTVSQIIIINDDTAPEFENPPTDISYQCLIDVPEMTSLEWTDNCDGTGMEMGTDSELNGGVCGGTITRTWTYTDLCGNTGTATQTFTINDDTDPEFESPPEDMSYQCEDDIPEMTSLSWTDICDDSGEVMGSDGDLIGGPCGGTITRTWTYTDNCGNVGTATQTFTINDDMAPELESVYDDELFVCESEIPNPPDIEFSDNCTISSEIEVEYTETSTIEDSEDDYQITRTWTATDACGNETIVMQIISVSNFINITSSNDLFCPEDFLADGFNLFNFISGEENYPIGEWLVSPDDFSIEDGQPASTTLLEDIDEETYIFTYVVSDGDCSAEIDVIFERDPDCGPLPCESITSDDISKTVTPNGDGRNEVFRINTIVAPNNDDNACTVDVIILNRWGAKIFEAQNYQNDWGATAHNNSVGASGKVPTGTYFYIVKLKLDGVVGETITGYIYVATN